jgi:hypothetical protein
MKIDEVRRFALSLPEATEAPHFDTASFRVRGKICATLPPGDELLHVFVGEDDSRASVVEDPDNFEELWWGKKLAGLRVSLAAADAHQVRELIEESWRRKAPKRLIAVLDSR